MATNATANPTPRERFINALERRTPFPGPVPHFELVFFLTMEAFGRLHPSQRIYGQWDQMEEKERRLHRADQADLYIQTARRYGHHAIFLHPNPGDFEETCRLVDLVRERSGDRYFLMMHGDATFGIPDGTSMEAFACRIADDLEGLKRDAARSVDHAIETAGRLRERTGLDGFALCSDYCLNTGPFLSPSQFSELVTPYLARLIRAYRDMGFYTIKHTDGNILPILDQLVQANPHALHSIDPQAGVDLADVKRRYGDRVCLCGNVNCGLLQTGTDEQVVEDTKRALRDGMPGGGYVFCTSNCIYTGMALSRYDLMLDTYRNFGNYA
ncbi:MAG: uroporphyrinogen decarboxylase family protein [Kiritimatiellia bacterium]|jgi:uroporphyrinogen decarboxylase